MGMHPIDLHVGKRIKARRRELEISQTALANACGITFQQLQKNEKGVNRCGASRLYQIGAALNVPVSYFFDDLPEELAAKAPLREFPSDPTTSREALELARAFHKITDEGTRRHLYGLAKAMANAD